MLLTLQVLFVLLIVGAWGALLVALVWNAEHEDETEGK